MIPSTFEKEETGESISCQLCGQVILLHPAKYPEWIIEEKIAHHFRLCSAKKAEDHDKLSGQIEITF